MLVPSENVHGPTIACRRHEVSLVWRETGKHYKPKSEVSTCEILTKLKEGWL